MHYCTIDTIMLNTRNYSFLFLIIGNHDYYTGDVDNWIQHLPSINVKPLINERVCLLAQNVETCENGLYIAGLEDIETRRLQLVKLTEL